MIRLMIVEDDDVIRDELKLLLENHGYEVCVVDNFHNVSEQILKSEADLVLLDVNLPEKSGLTIVSEVRKTSEVPVIFVTSQNTSMDELNCIMMGGDDYISKPYNVPILIARIQALLRRTKKQSSSSHILEHKGLSFDVVRGKIRVGDQEEELSKTELKIIYYLIEHRGEIVPRMDLIDYLWENQVYIDDNTLSVNVTRLRTKLANLGLTSYIETKRGMGYRI